MLSDGREIEGTVIEDGPKAVKVRVKRGTGDALVEIPRDQVRLVTKKTSDTAKLGKDAEEALALGHRDDAIRILRALVDAKPGDARTRRDLAFAELLDEQLERARDDYARAVALDGSDVEALIGLGYTSARTGEKDAAIAAYRKAVLVAPRHVRPWLALSELLLARNEKGDREDAVAAARHALDAQPQSADAALLAAEGLARAAAGDDRKAALALLEKFLAASPRAEGATRVAKRAADLAFGAGDAARAKGLLTGTIAAGPDVPADERERLLALEALYGWFAAGRSEPALGLDPASERLDLDAALRRLDFALETVPAEGALLLGRARFLARKDRRADAAEAAASAEAALPAGAAREDARLLRGFLEPGKDPKEERPLTGERGREPRESDDKAARRLVELLPFAFDAHELLGRALLASGDLAKARDSMKRASELAPESEKKRLAAEAERIEQLRTKREKNKDL